MTDYPPILLLLVPFAALAAAVAFLAAWGVVSFPFAVLVGRMLRDRAAEDAITARDFGEPTREQIEAGYGYGPRVIWGPSDRATGGDAA